MTPYYPIFLLFVTLFNYSIIVSTSYYSTKLCPNLYNFLITLRCSLKPPIFTLFYSFFSSVFFPAFNWTSLPPFPPFNSLFYSSLLQFLLCTISYNPLILFLTLYYSQFLPFNSSFLRFYSFYKR